MRHHNSIGAYYLKKRKQDLHLHARALFSFNNELIQTLILGTFKYTLHKARVLIYLYVSYHSIRRVPWFYKLVLNANQPFLPTVNCSAEDYI